jgi:hypothetical protein
MASGGKLGGGNLRFITKRRHGAPAFAAMEEADQRRELLGEAASEPFRNFSQHMAWPENRH